MTLSEVKQAIKVDYDDDDSYIQTLMKSAEEYITHGIAPYDDTSGRHQFLLIALVNDAYNQRSYSVEKSKNAPYIIRSMAAQLRDGW